MKGCIIRKKIEFNLEFFFISNMMPTGYPVISQGIIDVGDQVVPIDLSFTEPGVRKYNPDIDEPENIIGYRIQASKDLQFKYILISFNTNYSCSKLLEDFQHLKV